MTAYILFAAGVAADCHPGANGTPFAADVSLTLNLASWSLPPGTLLVVTVASATSFGEVQTMAQLSASGTITVSAPAASVLLVTGPASGRQVVSSEACAQAASIGAGSKSGVNFGKELTLPVSTSATADHSTTRVAVRARSLGTDACAAQHAQDGFSASGGQGPAAKWP